MMMFLEKGQKSSVRTSRAAWSTFSTNAPTANFRRGTFRVRGDVIEVFPTYDDMAYRIELWGDEISSLTQVDPLFGTVKQKYMRLPIYPKTHYVMKEETRASAVDSIKKSWRGGKSRWRSRDGWSRRSAYISAPCLIWK